MIVQEILNAGSLEERLNIIDRHTQSSKVRLVRVCTKTGELNIGDIILVHRYALDPSKWTVIKRVSDGHDPECNMYSNDIELLHTTRIFVKGRGGRGAILGGIMAGYSTSVKMPSSMV